MFLYLLLAIVNNIDPEKELILIERIALKDEKSLSRLYDMYSRIIFSLALKIVKKQKDAEEILQNVFMQIWEKASFFNVEKGNVYAWIVTMTRNKSIDKLRSKSYKADSMNLSLKEELASDINYQKKLTFDSAVAIERTEFVKKALEQLTDEQRHIIELAYFEGLTQNEISEEINIPVGTVKTRMRQAMTKLRETLSDYI